MPILDYSSPKKTERSIRVPTPLIVFLAVGIFEFCAFMITFQTLMDYVDTDDPNPPPDPAWLWPAVTIFMSPMVPVCFSVADTFAANWSLVWTVVAAVNALIWGSVASSVWMGFAYLRRR
jgi:hypothetical protein